METLIELAPLLAFFAAYKFGGIYVATGVLMGGMALLLVYDWLRTRKVPQMHLISAILVWVFGTATLLLHDVRFIQWKATVFYWLVALALGGTVWIGKMTLLERLVGKSVPEDVVVPATRWRGLSLFAAAFYLVLGALNLWVARTQTEAVWVNFKTWVVIPVVFVFTAILLFLILRGAPKETA